MRRIRFFTKLEEEEKWLNDMARQGYLLTRKTLLGYVFEPCGTTNAIIKMDYRIFKKRDDFEDYRALFEDSGWEHIAGTKSSGYQYFKKVDKDQGSIDIFSDVNSRAGRYKRLSDMWATLVCCFIPLMSAVISSGAMDMGVLRDPKALYQTPGLWDLSGEAFWSAFLFETPFALFRGFFWLFIPAMIAMYLYFLYIANKQYNKMQEDNITYK